MQTFLPYADFQTSLRCLDDKRLGKQRVEAEQIIKVIAMRRFTPNMAWARHPAVIMWSENIDALVVYYNISLFIWEDRGFENERCRPYDHAINFEYPTWLGDEEFHASHRSNLLRKDPTFYGKYKWTEPPNLAYKWPTP